VVNENITLQNPFILKFNIDSSLPGTNNEDKPNIIEAFEKTLIDICTGNLPLGGGTMRGNGVFTGKLIKKENGKEELLYPKE
jgi:hypothetical protein